MPVDWSRYPPDWADIRARIQARAGDRCEWCGVQNGAVGYRRTVDGSFVPWEEDGELPEEGRPVRIVCTTAHLGTPHADGTPGDKHDKHDVRDENLAFLCQRCHLIYDRDEHLANAAQTRRQKKIEAGQLELIEKTEKQLFAGEL